MADGTIWQVRAMKRAKQPEERARLVAALRACPLGLTASELSALTGIPARRVGGLLRYIRDEGLAKSRNEVASGGSGYSLRWSYSGGGADGRRRRGPPRNPRMLPVFQELHADAILRRDCRHETECVAELDDAYPDARHAVCREDCVYFQVIPPVAVGSAPSMLARAQTMIDMDVEFTVEERRRITAGRSWRKASAMSKEAAASRAGGKR